MLLENSLLKGLPVFEPNKTVYNFYDRNNIKILLRKFFLQLI